MRFEWPEILIFLPFSICYVAIFAQSVVLGVMHPYTHITESAAVLTSVSLAWIALSIHRAANTYVNKAMGMEL